MKGLPYYLALLIEVLVFHWRVLFSRGFLFPWDFRAVHLPLATFVADSFRRGSMPLWDPFTYCGNPIFANIQTALFYPPVLIATLASLVFGTASLPWLLEVAMILQIFFSGLCTFILLKRIGVQPAAAWIGATIYELGCFFASQAEHMGAVHGASWLPFAWLCVIELRSRFRWIWLAALSLALSMTVLAGLPQIAVAVFGSVACLSLALAAFRLARWTLPLQVLMSWPWALALAAVQVIPTIELTRNSVAKYRAEWLGGGGGIKPGAFYSLAIPDYWNVFDLSKFHGPSDPTFLYLYSSIVGLILAIAAMVWKPKRWTRAFAALLLAASIWMLGDSTPMGRFVLKLLPPSIRIGIHPEFTLCVFAFALALLAAIGADRLLRNTRLQVLAGIVIACDLIIVSSGRPMNTASVIADPGITHDSADGSAELIATLRALTHASSPPSRFDTTPSVSYEWSSTAPLTGIPTANGCDPLAPERVIQVRLSFSPGERWGSCYQVVNTSSAVLRLVNDRYLLSRLSLADAGLTLIAQKQGYKIYEIHGALPRFFLVHRTERVSGLSQAAARLHAENFDPSQVAIVEAQAGEFEQIPSAGGPQVDVLSYASSAVTLQTHSAVDSLLIATDTYYPGWKASIDGRPTRIYAADVAFRGIRVPAGDHRIGMRFVPHILYYSAILSLSALLATLAVILKATGNRAK